MVEVVLASGADIAGDVDSILFWQSRIFVVCLYIHVLCNVIYDPPQRVQRQVEHCRRRRRRARRRRRR